MKEASRVEKVAMYFITQRHRKKQKKTPLFGERGVTMEFIKKHRKKTSKKTVVSYLQRHGGGFAGGYVGKNTEQRQGIDLFFEPKVDRGHLGEDHHGGGGGVDPPVLHGPHRDHTL